MGSSADRTMRKLCPDCCTGVALSVWVWNPLRSATTRHISTPDACRPAGELRSRFNRSTSDTCASFAARPYHHFLQRMPASQMSPQHARLDLGRFSLR